MNPEFQQRLGFLYVQSKESGFVSAGVGYQVSYGRYPK
jgi:hypothetical protein